MTATQQSIIDAHDTLTSHSPWESALRKTAIEHVKSHGLPHRKVEAWKYTSLFQLQTKSFSLATTNTISMSDLEKLNLPDTPRLVCVNGIFQSQLSTVTDTSISIRNIQDVIQTQPELLKPYFDQSQFANDIGFAQTNTALFQGGLFIQLPKNYQANEILLLCLTTEQPELSMYHARNIIVLDTGSQAQIIEYHLGLAGNEQLASTINEIFLAGNATCNWTRLQNLATTHNHISETRVEQQRDSQFKHINIDIGSKLSRHDLHINLNQPGAYCSLHGLYDLNNTQHIDNHTTINHHASDTTSFEHYKGIIDDEAHAVFNGRVIVHRDAVRISTEQHNPNILLSKRAEIDTKPQLEIYNDDVQASHGATVGQLDETAIFYLQSRGIEKNAAIEMLLQGFIQEIVAMVTDKSWQQYIMTCLEDQQHECIR